MTRLAGYLKPYLLPILLCAALLLAQAGAELALPNYMSQIVNVGIQQGGVEHSSPEALSGQGLALACLFFTPQQQALAAGTYRPAPAESGAADRYPAAGAELFLLDGALSAEDRARLDAAFEQAGCGAALAARALAQGQLPAVEGGPLGGQPAGEAAPAGQEAGDGELSAQLPVGLLYPHLDALAAQPQALAPLVEAAGQAPAQLRQRAGALFCQALLAELGVQPSTLQTRYMLKTGGRMLLVALGGTLASILVGLLAARIGSGAARSLRKDIFCRVSGFSNREFDRFSTASLITRTTNDVTQLQMVVAMGLRIACYAPIIGLGGVFMALSKSSGMSWVLLIGVLAILALVLTVYFLGMPRFKRMQALTDRLNLVARESLSGLMVVRAFGAQQFQEDRFDGANRDLNRNMLFTSRLIACLMPAMNFAMNLLCLLIVFVGARQIAASRMQVGDMMAFLQYAMQIMMSFLMVSMIFILIPRASVSAGRVAELLTAEPAVSSPAHPLPLPRPGQGVTVAFHQVSFRYGASQGQVLQGIDFVAGPGQTTAFIGPTGSGKSTLLQLIPRFYDPTGGSITLNGVDLRQLDLSALRDAIGYVPQKAQLFRGSIADNLRYGRQGAPLEQLQQAAGTAQAADFIARQPGGFEAAVSTGGANFSGGQRQRLSIARALVKGAPVLLFDDSFSALDFKTDAALRRALRRATAHSTVLIVAQRVSTIMNADQIIVLEEGRVVGKGTHRQLMESCPTYREIACSQLSKEELE